MLYFCYINIYIYYYVSFFGNIESVIEFIWKWLFQVFSNHPTDLSEKKISRPRSGAVNSLMLGAWSVGCKGDSGCLYRKGSQLKRWNLNFGISPAEVGS